MRAAATRERIECFMAGRAVTAPGSVYFTGGASTVLLGWRETTLVLDLKPHPEPAGFFEALPRLKTILKINIELASPDDFVPVLPGWENRSQFIGTEGQVMFYHYDFYGQTLSKMERFHERDQRDLESMRGAGLVEPKRLLDLFAQVESKLIRYPAIDPARLRQRLEDFAR